MQSIRQDIFQHKLMLFYQQMSEPEVYFDIYPCKFLKNYLQNPIVNKDYKK